jgi:hypothetical protein
LTIYRPGIWIGVALRGFGGDPPPHRDALWKRLGTSFPNNLFRKDLFSRNDPYVVLTESFSLTTTSSSKDPYPEDTLALLLPGALEDAVRRLRRISPSFFDQWRSEGRELGVFIIVQTHAEKVRVPLPTEFLSTCSELKLAVEVYTDDGSTAGTSRSRKAKSPKRT